MNPSDIQKIKNIALEIDQVCTLSCGTPNNSEISTSNGRTYKVANVLEKGDGWEVTDRVIKGMFRCNSCGILPGDDWTQFSHGDDVVRMHCSLIHAFNEHPDNISQETLEKVAKVFLN
jgi:hypothetical protein